MNRISDIGSLLKKTYRHLNGSLIKELQKNGHVDLRPSFIEILIYVCENEGASIKDIGESCGLKKQTMTSHLNALESNLCRLEEKLDTIMAINKNHLIRIKHREEIPDEMILFSRAYNDLSPDQAHNIYENPDAEFMILDVSEKGFPKKINSAMHIPFSELKTRFNEINNKTTPIFVISEDGLNSILACDFLVSQSYFNINNISGGHKFWKGHKRPHEALSA